MKYEIFLKLYDELDSAVVAWPLARRYLPAIAISSLLLVGVILLFIW